MDDPHNIELKQILYNGELIYRKSIILYKLKKNKYTGMSKERRGKDT